MARTGFVNGTFDVLHLGHLKLLSYARSLCDTLVVGIDSDIRVSQLKGPSRPINSQYERKQMLLALKYVDTVYIFNSAEDLEQLIKYVNPDIMVVGSDYKNKNVIGSEFAKELRFYDRIPEYSSTEKIQYIIDRGHLY